jgi:predicted lipoprotein with Yx(FWY)xxD motif
MRKSGWAVAAAGFGSLVLLLTACGGSSSSSTTGSSGPTSTSNPAGQPSAAVSFPAPGTTVLIVQRSTLGWVMAKASEIVVYTYAKDRKGGPPTCTGSCASVWAPVTGVPKAGPVDNFPGTFGTVTMPNGAKQITYNGYPLYSYVGAPAFSTKGNGIDGVWHVIKLSASDVTPTG